MESSILPNETTIDREELAALRRDAARYRMIRDPEIIATGPTLNVMAMVLRREHPYTMAASGATLDDILDARLTHG